VPETAHDPSHQARTQTPLSHRSFGFAQEVMGHLKSDHRMARNFLAHATGDAINIVLAAAAYNFRRFLAWLKALWRACLAMLLGYRAVERLERDDI
jgi:transposase, IS5 family